MNKLGVSCKDDGVAKRWESLHQFTSSHMVGGKFELGPFGPSGVHVAPCNLFFSRSAIILSK